MQVASGTLPVVGASPQPSLFGDRLDLRTSFDVHLGTNGTAVDR